MRDLRAELRTSGRDRSLRSAVRITARNQRTSELFLVGSARRDRRSDDRDGRSPRAARGAFRSRRAGRHRSPSVRDSVRERQAGALVPRTEDADERAVAEDQEVDLSNGAPALAGTHPALAGSHPPAEAGAPPAEAGAPR